MQSRIRRKECDPYHSSYGHYRLFSMLLSPASSVERKTASKLGKGEMENKDGKLDERAPKFLVALDMDKAELR